MNNTSLLTCTKSDPFSRINLIHSSSFCFGNLSVWINVIFPLVLQKAPEDMNWHKAEARCLYKGYDGTLSDRSAKSRHKMMFIPHVLDHWPIELLHCNTRCRTPSTITELLHFFFVCIIHACSSSICTKIHLDMHKIVNVHIYVWFAILQSNTFFLKWDHSK